MRYNKEELFQHSLITDFTWLLNARVLQVTITTEILCHAKFCKLQEAAKT